MCGVSQCLPRIAARIFLAGLCLAWPWAGRGESLTPGELGTARARIAALSALREKVAADRVAIEQAQAKVKKAHDQLDKSRADLDGFLRANGIDPADIARQFDPAKVAAYVYLDAVTGALDQEQAKSEGLIRQQAAADARELARNEGDQHDAQLTALALNEELNDFHSAWIDKRHNLRVSVQRHWILVREAMDGLSTARSELAEAQANLDYHLGYFDESELERLQEAVASAGGGEAPRGDAPAVPEVVPSPESEPAAGATDVPETAHVEPPGFGDAPGDVVVEPRDGGAPAGLPAMTSEALLARFNDACSARNWALAQATLDEAGRGASWHETGVRALRNERERAAEGDQMHFAKCLELEGAMLAASRRRDWGAVQAFAAQARQAGCTLRPEAYSEIQQSIEQATARERQQQAFDFIMLQTIFNHLNTSDQDYLERQNRIQTPPASPPAPPPPHKPPPPPHRPTRKPTHGGPVRGSGTL